MKIALVALSAVSVLGLGMGTAGPARAARALRAPGPLPVTNITVNGDGGDRVYDGVGAVLGGGGNARYLMDYPAAERSQILDYLFKPGYGASLQLLKLEIGGDANSTDGAEPSIEHTRGQVGCDAGYEFSIARQAVALDRFLKLYGLQWGAPGWVAEGTGSIFTGDDISYLLAWLGCAKRHGLTISYLGGWNEMDNGRHAAWFARLRAALDAHGYRGSADRRGRHVHAAQLALRLGPGRRHPRQPRRLRLSDRGGRRRRPGAAPPGRRWAPASRCGPASSARWPRGRRPAAPPRARRRWTAPPSAGTSTPG